MPSVRNRDEYACLEEGSKVKGTSFCRNLLSGVYVLMVLVGYFMFGSATIRLVKSDYALGCGIIGLALQIFGVLILTCTEGSIAGALVASVFGADFLIFVIAFVVDHRVI